MSLESKQLLDEKEAAQRLDVEPHTLAVWRCTGRYKLKYVKVGRKIRYRVKDLEDWLSGRTVHA